MPDLIPPLSIHYATGSRFVDDVNEANCIPVPVSRSVKQTSASQLKKKKSWVGEKGAPRKIFRLSRSSGLNASFLLAECIVTPTREINHARIQSGYERRLLMALRHALREGTPLQWLQGTHYSF